MPFRHLAEHHLEEAILWSKLLAEPLWLGALLKIQRGEALGSLRDLAKVVARQKLWLQLRRDSATDADRLELCRYLYVAGQLQFRVGRLEDARLWLTEAWEGLGRLPLTVRAQESELSDDILIGIVCCLELEMKYEDACNFITRELSSELFYAYQPSGHHLLRALQEALAKLVLITRDWQSPVPAAELFGSLMNEIQGCEKPDAARGLRRQIIREVTRNDVNLHIQQLAEAIIAALKERIRLLEALLPSPPLELAPVQTTEEQLSKISDPAWRKALEKQTLAVRALAQEEMNRHKEIECLRQSALRLTVGMLQRNIVEVQRIASRVYRVPFRDRVQWLWWAVLRLFIQIVAIGYLLEKLLHKVLEEKGTLALQKLHFEPNEVLVACVVTLIGFGLGKIAEKKIDEQALNKYKRALVMFVANRSQVLWMTNNTLLKVLAGARQAVTELEEKQHSHSGETAPM